MPNDFEYFFFLVEYEDEGIKWARNCACDPIYFTTRLFAFFSFARTSDPMYVVHTVCMRHLSEFRFFWLIRRLRTANVKLHIVFFSWRAGSLLTLLWTCWQCGNSAFSWGMCSAFHICEHASRSPRVIGRKCYWTGVTRSSKYLLSIRNLCVVGLLTHTHTCSNKPSKN